VACPHPWWAEGNAYTYRVARGIFRSVLWQLCAEKAATGQRRSPESARNVTAICEAPRVPERRWAPSPQNFGSSRAPFQMIFVETGQDDFPVLLGRCKDGELLVLLPGGTVE